MTIQEWALIALLFFASTGGAYGAELRAHWDFEELKDNCFADRIGGLKISGPGGVDLSRFLTPGPEGTAFRFVPGKIDSSSNHGNIMTASVVGIALGVLYSIFK